MAETWLSIEQAAVALGLSVRTVNRHISANKLQSRLTDGRREVLVALRQPSLANAQKLVSAAGPAPFADGSPLSPVQAGPAPSAGVSDAPAVEPFAPAGGGTAATFGPTPRYPAAPSATVAPASDAAAPAAPPQAPAPGYDSQMVLALADSAAEKAELAVGAYQALARTAVTQVESTRRGARVAWSLVGVMAVGVVAAVGWTTHRLTRVEMESLHLKQQVTDATALADTVSAERDTLRQALAQAREQTAHTEGQLTALTDAQKREALRAAAQQPQERETMGGQLWSLIKGE